MLGKELFFDLPQAGFLLLLLIPLVYLQFALVRYRQRQQRHFASFPLITHLIIPRSALLTFTKIMGWSLVWTFLCLALMKPFGHVRYLSSTTPSSSRSAQAQLIPHEVIFLVDTSASMRVPDGPDGETRLEEAKDIMEDVVRHLRGQTVALYTFTSELSAVVPPTLDYLFMRLAIKDLHINEGDVGGTRFAPILKALQQQAFSQPSLKRYTIFLISDGGDTQLESLTGAKREREREAILNAISDPQSLHVRLSTVGVGGLQAQPIPRVSFENRPVLSKLEPEILKQLAAQGRGRYYRAEEWTTWDLAQQLVSQIEDNQQEDQAQRQVAIPKKEDVLVDLYFQIPLGIALLFYCMNLLLPDVRRL